MPTRGCFAVQCAAELAENESDVRARIVEYDARLRALVAGRIARAVANGDVAGDPEVLARLVATFVNGLQLEARKDIARDDAHALVELILTTLRATAAHPSHPSDHPPIPQETQVMNRLEHSR